MSDFCASIEQESQYFIPISRKTFFASTWIAPVWISGRNLRSLLTHASLRLDGIFEVKLGIFTRHPFRIIELKLQC